MNAEGRLQDKVHYSEEEVTNVPIDNTPFRLIGVRKIYFIAYGHEKISDNYETKEEALALVENRDWGLILTMMVVMIKRMDDDRHSGESISEMLDRQINGSNG